MSCTGKSASCLFRIAGAVILLLLLLRFIPAWFPYLFYLRVPLLAGLVLLALPIICVFALPSYLGNLFVLNSKWHLSFVIIMSILSSLAVVVMGGVIAANAPARFSVEPSGFLTAMLMRGSYWADALSIVLALPTCLFAFELSKDEMGFADTKFGAIIGVIGALIILSTVQWLPANSFGDSVEQLLLTVLSSLPVAANKGYIDNLQLSYGHLTAAVFFTVAAGIYVGALFLFRPNADKNKQREAPALFYVLELILVWSSIFSLLTFSLDYFRIPTLLLFITFSFLAYKLCKVDHYYTLKGKLPVQPPEDIDSVIALENRFNKYQAGEEHTLVVICASGGGIQAAGWTARVLAGLQELFTEEFTRAIGLISSVSGGSVGALHFLDRFDQGRATPDQLDAIFDAATEDSLGATGWGLSYPDLWRFIGAPFLRTTPMDRGAAIDLRWKSAMLHPSETLRGWGKKVISGELPIPVLNSTLVENGYAYRLSPMSLHETPNKHHGESHLPLKDFNELFPNYDLDASTAALLSATFPYVTPITRNSNPASDPQLPVFHAADGGFFDNFGVVTAVDWLDRLLTGQKPNIKRVMLVEIQAFYEKPPAIPTEATSQPAGWLMAVLGPLFTIANARNSTQAQRNGEEVKQLIEKWRCQDPSISITRHVIEFPDQPFFKFLLMEGEGRIQQTILRILKSLEGRGRFTQKMREKFEQSAYTPPLSWKLTEYQKQAIKSGWDKIKDGEAIEGIRKAWECGR